MRKLSLCMAARWAARSGIRGRGVMEERNTSTGGILRFEGRQGRGVKSLRSEFAGGFGEDFCVEVDVGFGGGWAHEGHVVEGSEKDAAIEGVKMEKALEFEVGGGGRFATVARRLCGEGVFGAGAESSHVPGKIGGADLRGNTIRETVGERNHVRE